MSGQVFDLVLSFLSSRWLPVVLDGKSCKNIRLILVFVKTPLLVYKCTFLNMPYGLAWNIVVMGLVLLIATCILISYKSRDVGLLVQHLLPLLNPCVIMET